MQEFTFGGGGRQGEGEADGHGQQPQQQQGWGEGGRGGPHVLCRPGLGGAARPGPPVRCHHRFVSPSGSLLVLVDQLVSMPVLALALVLLVAR